MNPDLQKALLQNAFCFVARDQTKTFIFLFTSVSSLRISAKPLCANFDTEYAPQNAFPIFETPEETK